MDPRLKKHSLGYWEIENKPSIEDLQKYYADTYYQEGKGSYELQYGSDELIYFNSKLEQRWTVIKQYLSELSKKPRMLDVGCGEGFALAFFRSHGWHVKGFDFSNSGVASKNPSCIDALVTGDIFSLLETEIEAGNPYDVIWLQNVLEHVLDPLELLGQLRKLVAPEGMAVVTVPNDCSITQRAALSKKHIDDAFWVMPPEHLTYFDNTSLKAIAEHTGWRCMEMLADFPADWFLFHDKSNYVRDRSVGKAAHVARVQVENFIHEQPIEDVISFWSAAAKLGIGRNITAFLKPSGAV